MTGEIAMMVPAILLLLMTGLYVHTSRLLRLAWKREKQWAQIAETNREAAVEAIGLSKRWEGVASDWREIAQKNVVSQ